MNKLTSRLLTFAPIAATAAYLAAPLAHAEVTPIALPANMGSQFTAFVGSQVTDPGTLTVIVLAIGLPLTFWLIGRGKKTVPGSGK